MRVHNRGESKVGEESRPASEVDDGTSDLLTVYNNVTEGNVEKAHLLYQRMGFFVYRTKRTKEG